MKKAAFQGGFFIGANGEHFIARPNSGKTVIIQVILWVFVCSSGYLLYFCNLILDSWPIRLRAVPDL